VTRASNPRPPISVVIPTREGGRAIAAVLDALVPQVEAVHGEIVVVVDGRGGPSSEEPPIRWISMADPNLLRLRATAVRAGQGEIIAIGEDHAIPRPGWCEAILRAHTEHPEAAAIVGCLINATAATVAGRANFLAFAAPYAPPMLALPANRPPPVSTLSFKRHALTDLGEATASLETELIPRLYHDGRMVTDPRIRVDHYQDHGLWWSVRNAFSVTRAAYGYANDRDSPQRRREIARWLLRHAPASHWRDAQPAAGRGFRAQVDLAAAGLISVAGALGGIAGTYAGPGRAPERMS
jgi:hypothetical protein